MKGKKFLTLSLTVAMLAGSALSVSAAGVADVFDANYYASKYSDLQTAFGNDAAALMKHFVTSGAKEGRVMSPILDVVAYRNAYADLNAAFGDNWDAYVDHYLSFGIKEGRTTGVLFDLADYAAKNADVKAAYGDDYAAIAQHYVNFGIKEGRPGGTIAKPVAAATTSSGSSSNSSNGGATTNTPAAPTTTAPAAHVHIEGEYKGGVPATCTTPGYEEWRCNAVLYENKYNAKGEWIGTGPKYIKDAEGNDVEMTCDQIWRKDLGVSHVQPVSEDQVYVEHATCAAPGVVIYTCTRCGKEQKEVVEALKVDYSATPVKSVASTSCRLADCGYDEYQCKNCHGTVHANKKVTREPLGHSVSWYANIKEPASCTKEGVRAGHCSVCGNEFEEKIDKLTHDTKTVTAYANSYVKNADGTLSPVQHDIWTVTYCKNCNEITVAVQGATVACDDGDGDGACDACKLPTNRQPRNHDPKIFKKGDKFSDKTE